jgi:hypothetical protein
LLVGNLSLPLTPLAGQRGQRERLLADSLRIYRYELDQRNCCEKNMLFPPKPLVS